MPDILNQIFKKLGLKCVGLVRNKRPGAEHYFLGHFGIGGQKSPVDETSISEIRVLALLGDIFEHIFQNLLPVFRSKQIQFHAAGQNLLLDYIGFVFEVVNEIGHKLVSIVNDFDVLSDDPDDGGFGFRVIQIVQILADVSEKSLVFVGVFPEDVPDDDYCLLNHIGDLCFKSLPQTLHALVCHFLQLDGALAHGVDCLSYKLDVHLVDVLFQLVQDHENILVVGYFGKDLQLLQLDVERVVVVDEEYFELFGQKQRSLLKD